MTLSIQENVSLKPYNSFGFDVSARYFAELTAADQIPELLDFARGQGLELLVIGGGSNLILRDSIDSLVLVNHIPGREVVKVAEGSVMIRAGAGEGWHSFVRWTLEQGYYGLENLSLIPGTVGAAPMQNIGAYGVELKDRMHSLEAFDCATGKVVSFSAAECDFGYRDSVFKSAEPGRYLILSVTFELSLSFEPLLHYGGISAEMERRGVSELDAMGLSDLICEVRSAKLPHPDQIGNAGSFFKNPVITDLQAKQLKQQYPGLVCFPDKPGFTKLAAGWLIDQLGWKGRRQGDAGVYDKQALVLVNHGLATADDILELARNIQADISEKFAVQLEIEPRIYP